MEAVREAFYVSKSKSAPTGESQLPGLSLSRFKAAVDAVAELAGSPGFLLFLSHPHRVRFVDQDGAFGTAFAKKTGAEESAGDVREARIEVRNFLQLYVATPNTESRMRVLSGYVYNEELEGMDAAAEKRFKELLRAKLEHVAGKDFSKNLLRRSDRLETATVPCLQDLDCEVISERQDRMEDERITQPFLRLRLRYTEQQGNSFPFFLPPWGNAGPSQTRSFELECDEDDIDLLILRLSEAKSMLLKTIAPRTQSASKD